MIIFHTCSVSNTLVLTHFLTHLASPPRPIASFYIQDLSQLGLPRETSATIFDAPEPHHGPTSEDQSNLMCFQTVRESQEQYLDSDARLVSQEPVQTALLPIPCSERCLFSNNLCRRRVTLRVQQIRGVYINDISCTSRALHVLGG